MKRRAIVVPLQPTPGCPGCADRTRGRCNLCMVGLCALANFGDKEAEAMLLTGNQRVDDEANLKLAEEAQ